VSCPRGAPPDLDEAEDQVRQIDEIGEAEEPRRGSEQDAEPIEAEVS
jgi:hypothetical protein